MANLALAEIQREARRLLAAHYAGSAVERDVVEWATQTVIAGIDTPGTLMLAASEPPTNWSDVERYFEQAITEIGGEYLPRSEALWGWAKERARDLVDGSSSLERALSDIGRAAVALGYPDELFDLTHSVEILEAGYEWSGNVDPKVWDHEIKRFAQDFLDRST